MSTPTRRGCDDRGQMLPFMALILVAIVGLLAFFVRLAPLVDDAARARTAADAAALAGAVDGRAAAQQFANANGAELVNFNRVNRKVTVRVRVGSASAVASAEATIRWVPSG